MMMAFQRCCAFAILLLAAATALSSSAFSQTAASPAEAANKLVAALAKGDIAGAANYTTAADRERFIAIMQASDNLAKSRERFAQTAGARLPASENAPQAALMARTTQPRIDHINIVAQRNIGANAADLDVKGFGIDGRGSSAPSTWHAVREGNQWRIELPPCASPAATAPILKRYQEMIVATDTVTKSVESGQVASLADAHVALFKAERGVLRAQGVSK